MRILVTGGCGFIGSHLIRELLAVKQVELLVNLDALTYSGNLANLAGVDDNRYIFIHGSINDEEVVGKAIEGNRIDCIVHLAAESHVDRSIDSVSEFVKTNVDGTRVLLEGAKKVADTGGEIFFVHVSTDEVYGSLGFDEPPFTEETPLKPRNPYAATKAASDMLVQSFVNTHGIKAIITRCSNNYGPNQHPEKLIPLMVNNAIEGKILPLYGDGKQIRDWIHVIDHCRGIVKSMFGLIDEKIESGGVINFGANNEITNLEIVRMIVASTGGSEDLIEFVTDRPGHDRRYAMGYDKALEKLGWFPEIEWERGIKQTIDWYSTNREWCENMLNNE